MLIVLTASSAVVPGIKVSVFIVVAVAMFSIVAVGGACLALLLVAGAGRLRRRFVLAGDLLPGVVANFPKGGGCCRLRFLPVAFR